MKTNVLLAFLMFLVSCNVSKPVSPGSEAPRTRTPGSDGKEEVVVEASSGPVLGVKNYNQYNMTLEKLTGLKRSAYHDLFENLKGSLPADNEISGLTPFNLVAMTRLADAYCFDFITRESTAELANDLNPMNSGEVRDFLLRRFLDGGDKEEKYEGLKTEVDNVLKNDDGAGNEIFPNASNDLKGNIGLATAACVVILASPYITLLN